MDNAEQHAQYARWTNRLNKLSPGFGNGSELGQATAFMHEQTRAVFNDDLVKAAIDSDYSMSSALINQKCAPTPIEQQSSPITGQLTPP